MSLLCKALNPIPAQGVLIGRIFSLFEQSWSQIYMNSFEEQVLRSLVELLVNNNFNDVAAIALEIQLSIFSSAESSQTSNDNLLDIQKLLSVTFEIPFTVFEEIDSNEHSRLVLERGIKALLKTQEFDFAEWDDSGSHPQVFPGTPENAEYRFNYKMILLEVEDGWKDKIKELIVESGVRNQGNITELAFAKEKRQPLLYNEMIFASQTEVRVAQELEKRKILFFPLPLAVRADTGNRYKDHREVDFLICHDGTWGILEVGGAKHQGRYEQDKEKDAWFKRSGILCIEHFTSEQAYQKTGQVIDEFLSVLQKHKR